jgi:regulator of nucleoside diphosphate kinase
MQPMVTEMDHTRLRNLLETPMAQGTPVIAGLLAQKLNRARLVPPTAVPPTVVTMNSRLSCWNPVTGTEREISLVYPWEHEPTAGRYSVLSQLGVELLGATPGRRLYIDTAPWEIVFLSFQPEADGALHL